MDLNIHPPYSEQDVYKRQPKGGEDFYLTTLAEMIFLIDKCIIVVVSLQVVSFIKDVYKRQALSRSSFGVFPDGCSNKSVTSSVVRIPSFIAAARPETAQPLYEFVKEELIGYGIPVCTGVFGADMKIEQYNDGPVSILIECEA